VSVVQTCADCCSEYFADSNNSAGYNTGDVQAAIDNYVFVQAFLVAYPEFVGRQTWLAGESYGGASVFFLFLS
jgi:carboxypeptidase C (cathepsin A)